MLCRADIAGACGARSSASRTRRCWSASTTTRPGRERKFLDQVQTTYPRKNWSSLMLFNNERCRALTPDYVNSASGLELHRFAWVDDALIGELPLEWNWLVGEYPLQRRPRRSCTSRSAVRSSTSTATATMPTNGSLSSAPQPADDAGREEVDAEDEQHAEPQQPAVGVEQVRQQRHALRRARSRASSGPAGSSARGRRGWRRSPRRTSCPCRRSPPSAGCRS